MSRSLSKSRRTFLKKALGTAILTGTVPAVHAASNIQLLSPEPLSRKRYAANDQVNIAIIGMGIMGFSNAQWSLKVPGVKLVSVCDLYTGRLDRAKEIYGKDLHTTKNYKELLNRKDIDVVIIATSDHWHDHMSIEAMTQGKHVYCE